MWHTQKEGQQESLLGVGAGSTGDFVSTLSPKETQNEVAGLVHVLSSRPHDWPSGSSCTSSVRLYRQEAAQKIKDTRTDLSFATDDALPPSGVTPTLQ